MSTGVTDKELGLNESNGDILFKINSILHNKLDLGDFFGPDSNNNNSSSSGGMTDKGGDSRPHHLLSSNNGEDSKVSLEVQHHHHSQQAQHPNHQKKRPAPLTLGDTSRLSDFLGLSSSSPSTSPKNFHAHPIRTTFKCGEFKEFPDVSSPLNKILCDDDMIMTSSSPNSLHRLRYGGESSIHHGVVPPSSSSALSCSSSNHFNFNNNHVNPPRLSSTEAGSPTFDEAILMGVSDKWDIGGGVVGRQSPPASGSDGVYGTNSSYSPSHLRGQQHQHHDSGISDIFKGLGLNESSCSRVGSYCGSTSSVGAGSSSLLDSPPPTTSGSSSLGGGTSSSSYFTSSRSTSSPPSMPSISEMDPAVAQAVKNIQNLQNLQTLYNYNDNEVGCSTSGGTSSSLERAARIHRNGTAIYDASCTWHGTFPQRKDKNIQLSCKVFLGGVPWDITEGALLTTFKPFGPIKIEWPGKDNSSIPRGYLYIIFENEKQVKDLLNACTHDYGNGGSWYYKISSRRMRNKEVQVIPWVISDSNFVRCPSQRLDPKKTVFVGALHGMLTAEGLCSIFHDLFGGVVYAGVDTDKYKYPQGSGRVTFNNHRSYMKAVSAAFIEIKAPKFTKKVQVDPYLEDELCSICGLRQGPYFCRDQACFKYFCRYCWELCHGIEMSHHNPLMRNSKPNNAMRSVPVNLPFAD